jgi:hypothetical protein
LAGRMRFNRRVRAIVLSSCGLVIQ